MLSASTNHHGRRHPRGTGTPARSRPEASASHRPAAGFTRVVVEWSMGMAWRDVVWHGMAWHGARPADDANIMLHMMARGALPCRHACGVLGEPAGGMDDAPR